METPHPRRIPWQAQIWDDRFLESSPLPPDQAASFKQAAPTLHAALTTILGPHGTVGMSKLEAASRDHHALALWQFLEASLVPYLPALRAPLAPEVNAELLEAVMGKAYEPFITGLHENLLPISAIQLVAVLNEVVGPRLPIPLDFLSLLQPGARARILDQVVWRWSRHWHLHPQAQNFEHLGIPMAPLLEYEVLTQFCKALRPLSGEFAK